MARIRHIAILTEDVEKLVKFYTTAFGLKIVQGIGTATIRAYQPGDHTHRTRAQGGRDGVEDRLVPLRLRSEDVASPRCMQRA